MTNPYAPPQAAVWDVADPHAGMLPAERGTRLGAAILDGIIFAVMVYLPFLIPAVLGTAATNPDGSGADVMIAIGLTAALVGFIAWAWLTILYMKRNGQSIAKKLMNIRVVRSDGSPVSLARLIWLRNVVNWLLSIVPLYGMIEVLFIFGELRQCLHDKLADTIVVKA